MAQSAACIGCASSSSIFLDRLSRDAVGEEGADFLRSGQRADHVERDPAEELGVGRRPRGCDAEGPELGEDLAVDDVALRDIGDGHDSSGGHQTPGRGEPAVVGGDDRRVARPETADLAARGRPRRRRRPGRGGRRRR